MQYSTLLTILSAPLLALAQQANPFNIPSEGLSAAAGTPLKLQWKPTTDGTVTLVLRSGSSNDLNEGTVIASSIDNSGSYSWTPSNSITRGSDYTIEIVDDSDPTNTNYTPYFVLDTTTTTSMTMSVVSLGRPSTTPDLSTASPTGDATSLTGMTGMSSSMSMTTSGMSMTTTTAADASMTNSASSSAESAASSGASSASQAAGSASASSSQDLNAPQQSGNAGSKKTAMFGMMGAVALGAIAL